jgi:hypothetical protein
MTFLFKIRIYDKHERQYFMDGQEKTEPIDNSWYRFDYYIDLNAVKITSFREYVLFDGDNPTRCIKIFLSDGDHLYGSYSMDKFVELFNNEYKELYTQWAESFGANALNNLLLQENVLPDDVSAEEESDESDDEKDGDIEK